MGIRGRIALSIVMAGILCAGIGGGIVYGYFVEKAGLPPKNQILRVERKAREVLGYPSEVEQELARIESTFIRFKGTLYPLPDSDYRNGGGMTLWGDDLLLMIRDGTLFRFEDGVGLQLTAVSPPENGFEDYIRVSQQEKYANYLHKPDTMRFNDIEYVERSNFRGLIVSYTFFDGERECYGTRLARLAVGADQKTITGFGAGPNDWEVFFETAPCLALNPTWTALDGMMAGGRFAVTEDGKVILGSGEYHLDGIHTYDVGIQSPENSYGKILSIDPISGEAEILAMGHRNVQGVAIDSAGEIWTVEHAVRGGDELNHIKPGENHGWPEVSYGTLYSGQPLPVPGVEGRHEVYDKPAFAWLPSAAVSALTSIDDFHPAWDGGLLAGSLSSSDFGRSLWHIRTEGEHVQFVERIRLDQRVRYVLQYGDKIAIWADPTNLIILEQERRKDPLGDALAEMESELDAEMLASVKTVFAGCGQCHSYEQFRHMAAPSLNGVVGRVIGGTDFDGYSAALASLDGVWTEERLKAYLDDPESFVPGGLMQDLGLGEGPLLDAVVSTLARIDTTDDTHLTYD